MIIYMVAILHWLGKAHCRSTVNFPMSNRVVLKNSYYAHGAAHRNWQPIGRMQLVTYLEMQVAIYDRIYVKIKNDSSKVINLGKSQAANKHGGR